MSGGAQLSVSEQRSVSRFPVHLPVIAEHRRLGDLKLNIINVSPTGFMVEDSLDLGRGERVTVRLLHIGRIEAFLVWSEGSRAGFQFERIVRQDDFMKMVRSLAPSARIRAVR